MFSIRLRVASLGTALAVFVLSVSSIGKAVLVFEATRWLGASELVLHSTLLVFQTLLAWWLASGVAPRGSRATALATFLVFSGVAARKTWNGDIDCGCFGIFPVSPAMILALDLFVVLLLAVGRWRPHSTNGGGPRKMSSPTTVFLSAGMVTIVALVGWVVWKDRTRSTSREVMRIQWDELERGVAPFFLPYLRGPHSGGVWRGRWLLFMHRPNCPACQEELKQFELASGEFGGVGLVIVELSAGSRRRVRSILPVWGLETRGESGPIDWIVDAPRVLYIDSGVIQSSFRTVADARRTLSQVLDSECE